MAKKINLTSGSIFAGNPITFTIQPETLDSPSFHRVIIEVNFDNGGSYETVKLTVPVTTEGNNVVLDVSSALRIPLDNFPYTATTKTFPLVRWYIKAYDEYMNKNGEVHTGVGEVYYPQKPVADTDTDLRCIAGAMSDMERILSNPSPAVKDFSRKPTSIPEVTVVGESFSYPVSYASSQILASSTALTAPTSSEQKITKEGSQTIGGHALYALPSSEAENRSTFRFINARGCLESINIPKAYSKKLSVETTPYTIAVQETFNTFSRSAIKKQNNRESWLYQSDPLDTAWLYWYLHEFLMSEHVWLKVKDTWLSCTITQEDEITISDNTTQNMYSVSVTAKLDINGSPYL